jgi:hypothetical protein
VKSFGYLLRDTRIARVAIGFSEERIRRSRHSSLTDRTKRSAWAFKFGLRGGSFTGSTPAALRILSNLSVYSGSRLWILTKGLRDGRRTSVFVVRARPPSLN